MSPAADQRENRAPVNAAELGQRSLRGVLRLARLRTGKDDTPARRLEPVQIEHIAACRFDFHWRR